MNLTATQVSILRELENLPSLTIIKTRRRDGSWEGIRRYNAAVGLAKAKKVEVKSEEVTESSQKTTRKILVICRKSS